MDKTILVFDIPAVEDPYFDQWLTDSSVKAAGMQQQGEEDGKQFYRNRD